MTFEFVVSNVDPAFANALRRTLISDVPSCAFGVVHMITNTSSYGDEYVAHRIGLVPVCLKSTLVDCQTDELVELYANCRGFIEQGFTVATYSLDISCAADATVARVCTTNDFVLLSCDLDGVVVSVIRDVPIVVLAPGQSVHFVAVVHFGTAKDHAKWSPVAAVGYKVKPQITVARRLTEATDDGATALDIEDIIASCPNKVFTESDGALVVADPWACTLCKQCLGTGQTGDVVINSARQKTVDVRFSVEPVGHMPASVCVEVAMRILQRKLQYAAQNLIALK